MKCSERDETERDIPLMDLLDRWELPHKIQDSMLSAGPDSRKGKMVKYYVFRELDVLSEGQGLLFEIFFCYRNLWIDPDQINSEPQF